MLKNILTGGIDLPELSSKVAALSLNYEETNAALADHIVKANAKHDASMMEVTSLRALVGSRALREDVETLNKRVERLSWEFLPPVDDSFIKTTGGQLTMGTKVARLEAAVDKLQAQVDALTATKLAEVKSRKKAA